jgi:hypothetical protein
VWFVAPIPELANSIPLVFLPCHSQSVVNDKKILGSTKGRFRNCRFLVAVKKSPLDILQRQDLQPERGDSPGAGTLLRMLETKLRVFELITSLPVVNMTEMWARPVPASTSSTGPGDPLATQGTSWFTSASGVD